MGLANCNNVPWQALCALAPAPQSATPRPTSYCLFLGQFQLLMTMYPQVRDDGGATEHPPSSSELASSSKQRLENEPCDAASISVQQRGWRRPHVAVAASVVLPLTPQQTFAIITHPENEQVGCWLVMIFLWCKGNAQGQPG